MQRNDADYRGIERIHPPSVRAKWALQASRVLGLIEEVVVTPRVGAQLGVISLQRERQRRAAWPAPDNLGGQQRLLGRARGLGANVLA
jgi:hypothetical protein